jgi:hypothetical protein
METQQIISISIQGLFLVVYVTVFLIQKKQINTLKDTISSMKSFMDIFNLDSIKKYVEIKEDHIKTVASMQILDNREIKNHLNDALNERGEEVAKLFHSQFEEQQYQLLYVAETVIMSLPQNEREEFVDKLLPSVKHILWPEIQKNENEEENKK